jgi:predicted ABC-type sugar transport system permease subunit
VINGSLIALLRLPPFIVTLGSDARSRRPFDSLALGDRLVGDPDLTGLIISKLPELGALWLPAAVLTAIAEAARMEPTERSMPPVIMTKVMPAASTVLTAACCSTMPRFWPLKKRPSDRK